MEGLKDQKCEACRLGAPRVTADEMNSLRTQIPGWSVIEEDGIQKLQRSFAFCNFMDALNFSHRVGIAADYENHHPRITTEWGEVTVTWWTHKIKGLHRNDFIMAAKTDALAG
ncbi:4a-hydroxytetrahydrobiopterin dehydratase [Mangrovibacterium marinum]|uniref:Putative pterin-4-alpha-carbinolamine dehydratase n=1 Tax=Mangrovibacterium marinum TaxID=1639118 RepID=A0A2T5C3A5_9BACT|nr:4a-hydroxytetrahydrobiopterin dehydratase [Mangrovibacterium marinum]PTN09243.1 pterin-4-alpha-carbinolamine dehydratase [Mangrovibacterium marinum]